MLGVKGSLKMVKHDWVVTLPNRVFICVCLLD